MAGKKKSLLPERSRKLIGDRLLDLIFIMVFFGIFWLAAGAALGLETGESSTLQYLAGGIGATLPIVGRIIKRASVLRAKIAVGAVWLVAAAGAAALFWAVF